ncbi:hypothetical protein GQ53DRAFT_517064 [Thozetella sp. PMI_491]|nr:hypothetical protein GQ53DRAFT_517064 [Thozetella sp. PMI_491]
MKAAVIFSLASLALGHVLEARQCAGNNCNRQVTGTRAGLPALASRSADCSSFLQVRVTASQRTVTVTSFVPPAATPVRREVVADKVVQARQVTVTPSAIPAYASSCDDAAEYSSACGCLGVSSVPTTTIRQPRATVTVTSAATDCASRAIAAVPTCGYPCFEALYPQYGCTGLDDLACQCANFEQFGWDVTPCLEASCTHQEVEAVFPAAQMGCDCYSVANPAPTAA